ncbi:MAG: S-methyl-5-thioribose-1-phosphate isomerase [Candidatus Eremiobacter antarcticus]
MKFAHISYDAGTVRILDQTKLPADMEFIDLRSWRESAEAIKGMRVRGAPAIGILAAYGLAQAARAAAGPAGAVAGAGASRNGASAHDLMSALEDAAEQLGAARPTAVNLRWALSKLLASARALAAGGASEQTIAAALESEARALHEADVESCRRIGRAGAALLPVGVSVLTHCNTGDLATGGYGTALGVIRSAFADKKLAHVYVSETRPLLQGSRLTAWELAQDGIPHTLITDSMAAHFMQAKAIGAVVVGADRIARNGDTANKIGTYGLAVIARAHDVPFIVAAPLSTFDAATGSGADITIEERSPEEVTLLYGRAHAPAGTHAANPAFDVTPAGLISAIATEGGVLRPPLAGAIDDMLSQEHEGSTATLEAAKGRAK